jgi:hypothetical protein
MQADTIGKGYSFQITLALMFRFPYFIRQILLGISNHLSFIRSYYKTLQDEWDIGGSILGMAQSIGHYFDYVGSPDKGPYSMFLKIENRERGSTRSLMTLEVCKILDQAAIKYDLIAPMTRRIREVTFFCRSVANQALSNTVLSQKGFLVWIPWINTYRKGIVREIPLDCTPLEIKEELNRTSPNHNVIDVTGMKRKQKKDGKAI